MNSLNKLACCVLTSLVLMSVAGGAGAADRERFEFTRMVAHWANYSDPEYLPFIKEAQPDVAQIGFYGAHFWSLSHTPFGKGYPAHFPVQGLKECGAWFSQRNADLHKLNVKAIGHMNVKFLVGDPDGEKGPRGFFKFYRDLWDIKSLGPKPVADPTDFLERKLDGSLIINKSYSIGGMHEYWACLNNPNWRKVLKAWTKHGIDQGLDGFMINYFYRHDCHCRHCIAGFKQHLRNRYGAAELKSQFGIGNLAKHKFSEIVAWHNPKESTPLRREMLQFSQIANKQAFDEVFVKYGRSLKPDLIVGQWNHLGNFSQINGDERCLLPGELWGRDEDYLWYSTGSSAFFTDLENGFLGEGTLQARYIRGAFDDKPFTLGKYESTRIRVAISELAANGGAPMGFYTRFTDPAARREIVRYYQFLKRYEELYRANRSQAEVLLIYPRGKVHAGDVAVVDVFKKIGLDLLNRHVLFDVRPDDDADRHKAKYAVVIDPATNVAVPKLPATLSRFKAPTTVRVSVSRPATANELTVHFVNYNRDEPKQKRSAGGGIKDERPIAVSGVEAELAIPNGRVVKALAMVTPEDSNPVTLKFTQSGGRIKFTIPEFLVYCVVRVTLSK